MSLKITLAVCRRTILLSLIICYIPTCFSSWFDTVPIIHNIQWLPTENTTFLYTRKLTDHRLISLHRQISGLREFLSELPQRQRLILIEFPPELQYIELCYHEATTWSRLPAYTLLDKTREAPIRENLFPKILPAPLDLSCTELGMTDGERLSLLSTDPVELARLAGLKLIELPARNPNDKKQGVSSVPGRGQKLPRSSFSLPSEPGPDDNWFPPPSPGSNIWEIMSPFFQGRMVENHSETIHRQGKPVLRLILQQGLLLEGIAPSGQVILRHFVPVLQMEAFLQWFMNFKPEMTRQWLGVDWQGEYLISGHQAAAAITHLYSQEMARKFRSPEHRSPESCNNERCGPNVPGMLETPLSKRRKTKRSSQSEAASPPTTSSSTHLSASHSQSSGTATVSVSVPSDRDEGGSEIPALFVHRHIREHPYCPMPGCDYGPCRCSQCISNPAPVKPGGTINDDYVPLESFSVLSSSSIDPLELGILLDLPSKLLLSLGQTKEQKNREGLKRTLMTAGDVLTVRNLQSALNVLTGHASSLSHTLDTWMRHQGVGASQTITDEAQIEEIYNILLSLADQWDDLYIEFNNESPDNMANEIESGVSQEACLFEVLRHVPDLTVKKLIAALEGLEDHDSVEILKTRYNDRLDEKITAREATSVIHSVAYEWEDLGAELDVPSDEMEVIEGYRVKNLYSHHRYKVVLQHACQQGSLVKKRIIQAAKILKFKALGEQLEQVWGKTELPAKKELWHSILSALELGNKPSIAKIFALMKMSTLYGESVMLAVNQPPSNINTGSGDFAYQLLVADTQGELIPEALLTMLKSFPRMCDHQDYSEIEARLRRLVSRGSQAALSRLTFESKVLQWRDLYELTSKGQDSLNIAVWTSLLLGVAVPSADLHVYRDKPNYAAVSIWENILRGFPYLQTGHLKQLFETFPDMQGFISLLPAGEETEQPTVELRGLSPLSDEIVQVAKNLLLAKRYLSLIDVGQASDLSAYIYLPFYLKPVASALVNEFGLKQLFVQASEILSVSPVFWGSSKQPVVSMGNVPPDNYICPITLQPIDDPVAILTGGRIFRYFSKAALLKTLKIDPRNPLSREPLSYKQVKGMTVDYEQRHRIKAWKSMHLDY